MCLLPFLALSAYSHPALDDFSDAVMRRRMGFLESQAFLYHHWTGRFFTSVLLTDLSPLRLRHWANVYFLVPLLSLLLLSSALFAVFRLLTHGTWTTRQQALASGVVLSLWLFQAPSVAECLYWYNGVAVYTIPLALFLFWMSALLKLLAPLAPGAPTAGRGWYFGAVLLLSIALVGSNELLALVVLSGLFCLTITAARRQLGAPGLGLLLVAAGTAAAVAFLAPGNMQRMHSITQTVSIGRAFLGVVGSSAYLIVNWLSSGIILLTTALAFPVCVRLVRSNAVARMLARQHPVVVGAILLGLLLLVGLPSYVGTGGMMPLRARTLVYFLFLMGWLGFTLTLAYRFGPTKNPHATAAFEWPLPVSAVLWGWLAVSFLSDHNLRIESKLMGQASNNVLLAYRDWLTGDAGRYNAQLLGRYQLLEHEQGSIVRVMPLAAEPKSLIYYDITTDSTYWGNRAYAQFFGNKSVRVGPGGHAPPP